MKKNLLIVYIFVLWSGFVFSQSAFDRYYTFDKWTRSNKVIEIPGEGYYAIGHNSILFFDSLNQPSGGQNLGIIVKLDNNGDTVETFQIGGNDTMYHYLYGGDSDDFFRAGCVLNDGFVAAGETQSYNAQNYYDYDLWLVKFNSNLDTLWSQTFSVPDSQIITSGTANMIQLSNGDFAIPGSQRNYLTWGNRHGHLTVFDSTGNLKKHFRFTNPSSSTIIGVAEASNNGFILSGIKFNGTNDESPLIFKIDSSGNTVWMTVLPYSGDLHFAQNIIRAQDGNYIYVWANVYFPVGAQYKMWYYHATKINEQGGEIWTKNYVYSYDGSQYIREMADGKLMISGWYTDTLGNGKQALLMLCNSNGDSIWSRKFNGPSGTNSGTFLICMDGIPTVDTGVLLGGESYCCNYDSILGYHTSSMWLLKIDSLGLIELGFNEPFVNNSQIGIPYPNPSSTQTTVTVLVPPTNHNGITGEKGAQLLIFDMQGRQLQKHLLQTGLNTLTIDVSSLASGEYLCVLALDGYNAGGRKFIVNR